MDVLVFEVGGVRYGLPALQVREIARAVTIVPLPRAPAIVEGVIDVHGTLVPVLDLRARFQLPAKPLSHTDHLILAWAGPRLVAVRADRATGLHRIDPEQIDAGKGGVPGVDHVVGIAKLPDGLVLVHDLRGFLDQAESTALEGAVADTPSKDLS